MEMYRKMLAMPGLWDTANGPTNITPERNRRWAQKFNEMRRIGLAPPVPWGHKLSAVPLMRPDMLPEEQQAAAEQLEQAYSQWNTGYMEHAEYDATNGCLYYHGAVPPGYKLNAATGCLENSITGTAIKEVSPGIGDWVDGYGNEHKDVIIHAALVTHPVQPGMTGFERSNLAPQAAVTSLSNVRRIKPTFFFLGGRPMPKPDDETDDKKPVPPKKDGDSDDGPPPKKSADNDGDTGGTTPLDAEPLPDDFGGEDIAPVAPAPDPAAATGLAGAMTPQMVEQFKQIFQMLGQPLLPNTDISNMLERMLVVLHTAANNGASLSPQQSGQPDAANLDLGMDDASPDKGAYGSAPTFMSSLTGKVHAFDTAGRNLAMNAAKKEADAICAAWDKVAAKGSAELKAYCAQEKAKVGRMSLSFNPNTGRVALPAARQRLQDVKDVLVASGQFKFVKQLSKAVPEKLPTDGVADPTPGAAGSNNSAIAAEIARLVEKTQGVKIDPASISILNRQRV